MNKIEAGLDISEYGAPDYLNFLIDDNWLDELLDDLYPNKDIKNLIPTLSYHLSDSNERELVWARILPAENTTSTCPILMCPDDCDFACSLIVAEIHNSGEHIEWRRFGFSRDWEVEKIGSDVDWLGQALNFSFNKSDYVLMVDTFRKQLQVSQYDYDNGQ